MYDSRTRDGVVAVVMAGGEGSRLRPLTSVRAKPAVRFGGIWRIIDFTLSNCVNSGIRQILVLTQYKSDSLNLHLDRAWSFLSHELGEFVWNMPPQMRNGGDWYQGTADAVWQNLWKLRAARPKRVVILSADHVYKMDYRRMLAFQEARGADVLIAAHPVPRAEANGFGVIAVDVDGRVREFVEKPGPTVVPPTMPGRPDTCLANMGIYSFPAELLFDVLDEFPGNGGGTDFGRDILPALVARGEAVYAWPFEDENGDVRGPYWRDVGTLDALHAANMDLVSVNPQLNLYDEHWPIRALHHNLPPAKFVFAGAPGGRRGEALDSLVSAGCIVSGGTVVESLLSPGVRVNSFARVQSSVLMDGVVVGRGAQIRNAIIDCDVQVPSGARIGFDAEEDRERGFTVTPGGVVVIGRDQPVPAVARPARATSRPLETAEL